MNSPYKYVLYCLLLVFITETASYALNKRDYQLVCLLGADTHRNTGNIIRTIPLLNVSYINYYGSSRSLEFTQYTNMTKINYVYENNDLFRIKISPEMGYFTFGAYSAYDKGVEDRSRVFMGNYLGIESAVTYKLTAPLNVSVSYTPAWYHYTSYDDTEIELPDKHWEHKGTCTLQYKSVQEEYLGVIKHGFLMKFVSSYIKRAGYGTFHDADTIEDSQVDSTTKLYAQMGLYYKLPYTYNIKFDITGSIQFDVDRNNGEQIGGLNSKLGYMPGYFFAEFIHDRYLITSLKLGMPAGQSDIRVEPGAHLLYMPKKNNVIGVNDYPREIYRSLSISLVFKIGGLLPCFLSYAYGIDAQRDEKEGNHEMRIMVASAFFNQNK